MEIIRDLLTINPYSRPGTPLFEVTKLVVHYIGNPGTSAKANRDYFESLATTHLTSVSSHYIVGLAGEIIQCVPEEEIAYCSNHANNYSISIENCHPDPTGLFLPATQYALVQLLSDLCRRYQLNPWEDIIRHYDVTGKICPKWYVDHPADWAGLKDWVADLL